MTLHDLTRVLRLFRLLDPLIPSQRIECFVAVALGAQTQRAVAERVGVSVNSAGRNLNALAGDTYSIYPYRYSKGLALVDARPDPEHSFRKVYKLSTRGQAMLRQIVEAG